MSRGTRTGETAESTRRARQPRPRRIPVVTAVGEIRPVAHAAAVLSAVALAVGVYHGSLHGAFVFDDLNAVSQSMLIRSLTPLQRFLTNSTRPLVDFGFAVNYALGGLDTWWFHFTNVVLHAANCVLVYLLGVRTLALPGVAARYGARRQPIAWAAAALFAVHPLASETVAYVSSRSEVQVAFFYLGTLCAYAIAHTARERRTRQVARIAVPVLGAAALGSKEIAVTLPAALLLYDWIFLAGGDIRQIGPRWKTLALSLIPLGVALAFVLALRPGAVFAPYSQSAGFNFDRYTRWQYLMTQFGVVLFYLRLVLLPIGLNFDYDWPLTGALSPAVALSLVLLLALAASAVLLRRRQPLWAFALLFTLVVLSPTSSFIPLADLAVERRMYIPLVGFALLAAGLLGDAVAWMADRLGGISARMRQVAYAAAVVVPLAVLGALTNARATLWGNDLQLHLDAVAKSPNSPRVRLNLGVIYLNTQHVADAHRELFEAKRLYDLGESIHAFPRIGAFIHYNLGAVLYIERDYDGADAQLKRALELGGNFLALRPMAYLIRAHIARNKSDWKTTEAFIEEALKYNQDHADWYLVLAEAQSRLNKFRLAGATLDRAELKQPGITKSGYGLSLRESVDEVLARRARRRESGS